MEDKEFPDKIIVSKEAETARFKLRRLIGNVQSSFLSLRDDSDFTLPPSLEQLTPDYSRRYYAPFQDAIDHDITLDEEQRRKLKNRWARIQAATTTKVNVVHDGIAETPYLRWVYDEQLRLPTPTASVESVAEMLATFPVPQGAKEHWEALKKVVQSYKDLRKFEEENNIAKKPLQWLFRLSQQSFIEEWSSGGFSKPEAPDVTTAERWKLINKGIF
jgi:hypothetical protein